MSGTGKGEPPSKRLLTTAIMGIVVVLAFLCCGYFRLSNLERLTIVIPIPDPPNTETRTRRYGGYLRGEFIWQKEYWIDARQFEDEVSIQQYFDSWLLSNGWMDVPSFVAEPTAACIAFADIQHEETENAISKTYVSQSWSSPAPLELACVVIMYDTAQQSYHVQLITVNPSPLSQLLA